MGKIKQAASKIPNLLGVLGKINVVAGFLWVMRPCPHATTSTLMFIVLFFFTHSLMNCNCLFSLKFNRNEFIADSVNVSQGFLLKLSFSLLCKDESINE